MTGVQKSTVLEPAIVEDELYFHDDNIKVYDFNTTTVSIFSGDMELDLW